GFPKFKSKKSRRQSYKSKCVGTNIKIVGGFVQLPKLGLVKCRISKEVKGRILSATISQNPSGKHFVSLCCTDVEIDPLPSTGAVVGLDMGLKAFAITSDGMEYPNHKYLSKGLRKLARLQRQHIDARRMGARELSHRDAVGGKAAGKTVPGQVCAPDSVCAGHIPGQRTLDADAQIGDKPVLPKGFGQGAHSAVTDVFPSRVRVVKQKHNFLLGC